MLQKIPHHLARVGFALSIIVHCFEGIFGLCFGFCSFNMRTKIKGIYKRFKYISQFFGNRSTVAVKDHEMDIGYPTNVKHLAHIGSDDSAGNAPTWMDEFKTRSDFAARSVSNSYTALSSWSFQDFGKTPEEQVSDMYSGMQVINFQNNGTKPKRKNHRSKSFPKFSSSST